MTTREWRPVRRGTWCFSFEERPDAAVRLFCFPHSGGGASVFNGWSSLPADMIIVELPGRGTRLREPCRNDLPAMVAEIAAEIAGFEPRPCVFFGHSVGALVAYEVIKQLRSTGAALPSVLVVSAGRAPNTPASLPPDMSDEDILGLVSEFGGVSAELAGQPDLLRVWVEPLRADLQLLDRYVYVEQEQLPMPIVLFGGLHDDVVTLDDMEAWAELTDAGTSMELFPGDHFYFLKDAKAQVLTALTRQLTAIHTEGTPA